MLTDIKKSPDAGASGGKGKPRKAGADPESISRWIAKGRRYCDEGKYKEAKIWYEKAAEAGSGEGALLLGRLLYEHKDGSWKDTEPSFWLEIAYIRGGFKEAARLLGEYYCDVEQPEKADHWYFSVYGCTDPLIFYEVAESYVNELVWLRYERSCEEEEWGADGLAGDPAEEERCSDRAYELFEAASGACPEAELRMGELLSWKGPEERDRAVAHFLKAASRGLTEGYLEAGRLKTEAGDLAGAKRLYIMAARDGWSDAFFDFAEALARRGGELNEREASVWYLRAAALGDMDALFEAGKRLLEGRHVKQDFRKGAGYLLKASAQNCERAFEVCGILAPVSGRLDAKERARLKEIIEDCHTEQRKAFLEDGCGFFDSEELAALRLEAEGEESCRGAGGSAGEALPVGAGDRDKRKG